MNRRGFLVALWSVPAALVASGASKGRNEGLSYTNLEDATEDFEKLVLDRELYRQDYRSHYARICQGDDDMMTDLWKHGAESLAALNYRQNLYLNQVLYRD